MRLIMNKKGVFGYLGLRFVVNFNPFILGILITSFLFLQVYQKEHIFWNELFIQKNWEVIHFPPRRRIY